MSLLTEIQFHPISMLFPLIIDEEFSSLRNDIDVNDQREPIVLHEGMILDGRNRYRACCDLELTPITKEFEGDDPLAWVLSHNLFRRQLTVAQRALIAAELSTLQNDKADSEGGEGKPEQIAIDKAAKQLGISARTVASACKVVRDGTPALLEAVKNGQIRSSAAEQISMLDEENQKDLCEQGPKAISQAARDIRQDSMKPKAKKATKQSAAVTVVADGDEVIRDSIVALHGNLYQSPALYPDRRGPAGKILFDLAVRALDNGETPQALVEISLRPSMRTAIRRCCSSPSMPWRRLKTGSLPRSGVVTPIQEDRLEYGDDEYKNG